VFANVIVLYHLTWRWTHKAPIARARQKAKLVEGLTKEQTRVYSLEVMSARCSMLFAYLATFGLFNTQINFMFGNEFKFCLFSLQLNAVMYGLARLSSYIYMLTRIQAFCGYKLINEARVRKVQGGTIVIGAMTAGAVVFVIDFSEDANFYCNYTFKPFFGLMVFGTALFLDIFVSGYLYTQLWKLMKQIKRLEMETEKTQDRDGIEISRADLEAVNVIVNYVAFWGLFALGATSFTIVSVTFASGVGYMIGVDCVLTMLAMHRMLLPYDIVLYRYHSKLARNSGKLSSVELGVLKNNTSTGANEGSFVSLPETSRVGFSDVTSSEFQRKKMHSSASSLPYGTPLKMLPLSSGESYFGAVGNIATPIQSRKRNIRLSKKNQSRTSSGSPDAGRKRASRKSDHTSNADFSLPNVTIISSPQSGIPSASSPGLPTIWSKPGLKPGPRSSSNMDGPETEHARQVNPR